MTGLNLFPYRMPVVRLAEAVTGRDAYGNDVLTPTRVDLLAQAVWPLDVEEDTDGRQQVVAGWKLVLDPGTPVSERDRFEIAGQLCEVTAVRDWTNVRNPFTGDSAGVEVTLTRVTG